MASTRTAPLPAGTTDAMSLTDPATPLAPWLEQIWLDRYLDRELDEGAHAAFETYLLTRPHLIAALEADNALRALMHAAAARAPVLPSALPPHDATKVEAPTRLAYDLGMDASTSPCEFPGDPEARSMLVEFALPPGWRIAAMWVLDGAPPQPLPPPASAHAGRVTCRLPSGCRGRARLQLDLKQTGSDARRTVECRL
jgi:hypothetical protein